MGFNRFHPASGRPLPQDFILRFHDLEGRSHLAGYRYGPPAVDIHEGPLGLRPRQNLAAMAGVAQEQGAARRLPLCHGCHPGAYYDLVAKQCRPQILDEMGADVPGCPAVQIAFHRPALGGRVLDGDLLHPAQIFLVIDVAVNIYGVPGHQDLLDVDSRHGGGSLTALSGIRWRWPVMEDTAIRGR